MKKRNGISLIVLVITIIVIIILAGSVILSLSKNNPIDKASEATFKTTSREYTTELDLKTLTNLANGTNPTNLEVPSLNIKDQISQIKSIDESKYNIQNGELAYIGTNAAEGKWINEMDILNGNPPKIQSINIPNVVATDESMTSGKLANDGKLVTLTGMTVSTQRHSYINLISKEYSMIKRVDVYLGINTYLTDLKILSNGNIAITGYTSDASNNLKAIMLLYSSSLDEIKREIYPVPKLGYTSYGVSVVNTPSGGYMLVNSAQKYNASNQLTDTYASIYSYDANGNKILDNVEVRGLNTPIFMVYDAELSPNGNIYICGDNYKNSKQTPNVVGINVAGQVIYEYILSTTDPVGEYRTMTVVSDGTLVLHRIGCTTNVGNPYESAVESIDYLNVNNNQIKNVNLGIPAGLPCILDLTTGYMDNVFVIYLDSTEAPTIYKYKICKLSKSGDVRWDIIGQVGQMNVVLTALYPSKNKYIIFGQYKSTTTSPYAAYIAELIP